jgi:hypothetical protein
MNMFGLRYRYTPYFDGMIIILIKKSEWGKDPRWRLEGGSRHGEICKSKILRCWSHTWQKKTTKKK